MRPAMMHSLETVAMSLSKTVQISSLDDTLK